MIALAGLIFSISGIILYIGLNGDWNLIENGIII